MNRLLNTKNLKKTKRGKAKITPTEKIEMAEAEMAINSLRVNRCIVFNKNDRNFKNRIRATLSRTQGKEFTSWAPENKEKFIIVRLS